MQPRQLRTLIEDVMSAQPNSGTLLRAAILSDPVWGGRGSRGVEELCNSYFFGDQRRHVSETLEYLTSENCAPILVIESGFGGESLKWAIRQDAVYDYDTPQNVRLRAIAAGGDYRRVQELEDFLWKDEDKDLETMRLADSYFRNFVVTENEEHRLKVYLAERVMNWAPDALDLDPFDNSLLDLVAGRFSIWFEDTPYWTYTDDAPKLYARRLVAAPYDGYSWNMLARTFDQSYKPIWPQELENMYANALVYSMYDPEVTQSVILTRHLAYSTLENRLTRIGDLDLSENGKALRTMADAILCPVVRINRIEELMCQADSARFASQCYNVAEPAYDRARLLDVANRLDLCRREANGGWSEIAHLQHAIDLTPYIDYEIPSEIIEDTTSTF